MRQKFGQNFLSDKNIALKIVDSAELTSDNTVIEIGPGKGVLTEIIAPKVKNLIAVEIDKRLFDNLKNKFAAAPNTSIINQDFLDYVLPEGREFKIIANLPYYVATALLRKFFPSNKWKTAVVMLQKEVAERITAKPGCKEYGAFTVLCQYYASCELLFKVGPKCFMPPPKVESAVVLLKNLCPPPIDADLIKVVNLSFQQRRKTILNSLSHNLDCDKSELLQAFRIACVDPCLRAEKLDLKAFQGLTLALKSYSILKWKHNK